ncbi:MAG: transporter related protein [Actinomycetia bacterium]|nr:transporter related protein [Actinomycetes bacterium]MDQ1459850.1 branched-chain amino acid transport system ATP-binding protein livF [Actinomycetota bacterium]
MTDTRPPSRPLLVVDALSVSYGEAKAVSGVSFTLAPGRAVAVLGANGSGKSSLAAALVGVVRPSGGRVSFDGVDITRRPAHRVSRAGIAYVPEGRGIYPHLTVADNLRAMLRYAVPRGDRQDALERAVELFPVLGQRRKQAAGTLSGGEQQMLSLARVLAAPPKLLVADEMSLGLAPKMVDVVFDSLTRAKDAGVTVVLVEQYVERALALADDAIVLRQGVIAWSGAAADAHTQVVASYLGGEPL